RGLPLGGQVAENNIREDIFSLGLPINKAYDKWLSYKGVQSALKGTHISARKEFTNEVKRTIEWMKHKLPLQYASSFSKEELEQYDVLNLSLTVPFGNQKVIQILEEICPNDFQAFPIKIHTSTGVTDRYSLINISHVIHSALDGNTSIYDLYFNKNDGDENSVMSFDRLLFKENCMGDKFLGRIYEDLGRVMVNKKVMDEFQAKHIVGINFEPLEDKINGLYKRNYELDGVTLKY
ncbi:MAG: hypothetical protein HRT90_08855, partial [Candidatus Margulisbacteria bacterium]|nr:hypothetical protein [Candidatus Margulisiibacteriota bacterium]